MFSHIAIYTTEGKVSRHWNIQQILSEHDARMVSAGDVLEYKNFIVLGAEDSVL